MDPTQPTKKRKNLDPTQPNPWTTLCKQGILLVCGQRELTEAEYSFPETAQLQIGLVERIPPVGGQRLLVAVDEDRRTAVDDALRCALHHQQVLSAAATRLLVDRYLCESHDAAHRYTPGVICLSVCGRQTWNWVIGSPGQWVIWVTFHVRVTGSSF